MEKVLFFIVITLVVVSFSGLVSAAQTISSCQPLDVIGETYFLDSDISDNSLTGPCFDITESGITLDCQGHSIVSLDYVPGVYSDGFSNLEIRNCTIDMGYSGEGIYLVNSDSIDISNVYLKLSGQGLRLENTNNVYMWNSTVDNNFFEGILLTNSDSNTFYNVTIIESPEGVVMTDSMFNVFNDSKIEENDDFDVFINANTEAGCENEFDNVIGSGGLPIGYFWGDGISLSDEDYSQLVLCDTDFANVVDVDVMGGSKYNNGIMLILTENAQFNNVDSTSNKYGLWFRSSTLNTITTGTLEENGEYDLYVSGLDTFCENTMNGVTGSGGRAIRYYHSSAWDIKDSTYSNVILCNADYSKVTNVVIDGSDTLDNNALFLHRSDNVNISLLTSNDNENGILIQYGNFNIIEQSNLNDNDISGVRLYLANNNRIENNTIADDNDENGYFIDNSVNNLIQYDVYARNNGDYGFYIRNSDSNFFIDRVYANQNFDNGYYVSSSDNNHFSNVFGNNNWEYGFEFYLSSSNSIGGSVFEENLLYDVVVAASSDTHCDNHLGGGIALDTVNGSGGWPIGYYNSSNNIVNRNFSELILCNADSAFVENVNVSGSTTLKNNGIYVYRTSGAEIGNVMSNRNFRGVYFRSSPNNLLHQSTFFDNDDGIYSYLSDGITIEDGVTVSYNDDDGIYFYRSNSCFIQNNVFSLSNQDTGIHLDESDFNTIRDEVIISNNENDGIYLDDSDDNIIQDNITLMWNWDDGIYVTNSDRNILENVTSNNNGDHGFYLYSGNDNILINITTNQNNDNGMHFGNNFLNTEVIAAQSCYNTNEDIDCSLVQDMFIDNACDVFNPVCGVGTCPFACLIIGECGDGIQNPGEECDDGGLCDDNGANCTTLDLSLCGNPGTANCIPQSGDYCDEFCDIEECVFDSDCDDNIWCTLNECQVGVCEYDTDSCIACSMDEDCDDGLSCTIDTCDTGEGEGVCQFIDDPGCVPDFCLDNEPWEYFEDPDCTAGCDVEWCNNYDFLNDPGIAEEACNTDCALASARERAFYGLSEGSCEWDVDDNFCYFSHFDCRIISEFGDCNVDTNQRTITFWSEDQDGMVNTLECPSPCDAPDGNGLCYRDTTCAQVVQLPLFDLRGVVLSVIVIGLIYYFMFRKKNLKKRKK